MALRVLSVTVLVALAVVGGLRLRGTPPAPAPVDVVVITVDTLRPDAVGDHTPALDAFLATARRFTGARTVAPLTVPAHASLFSGLAPAAHGAHDNAAAVDGGRSFDFLAEEFRAAGYATAAFVAAPVLNRHAGLAAGFDLYREADVAPYVPAEPQLAAATAWLKEPGTKPRFLWVHFFDPHFPYGAFAGDARRPATAATDPDAVRYRGEVRRVDAAVERLLGAVDPDAIVVLASDHGESLGAHGEPTHGPLCYGSTIDAVLAIRAPGFAPGSVDATPRSLVDVAPTLRELAGLAPRESDGRPLRGPGAPVVVAESLQVWRIHGWGQCFSASDGRYTLVENGPGVELFDRREDPDEQHPLAPEGHEAYERLDRALAAYRSRSLDGVPDFQPDVATPYGSGRRRAGAYLARPENAKQVDPRARLGWWADLDRLAYAAKFAHARRDPDALLEAIERIRLLMPADPRNPAPWWALAQAQGDMARLTRNRSWHAEAVLSARAAIERGYAGSAVIRKLIEESLEGSDNAEVLRALATAAEIDTVLDGPALASARRAAKILVRLGHADAAALEARLTARAEARGTARQ